MSMKNLETLQDMLCDELDEIAQKGEMSAGDLDTVHKLTDTGTATATLIAVGTTSGGTTPEMAGVSR